MERKRRSRSEAAVRAAIKRDGARLVQDIEDYEFLGYEAEASRLGELGIPSNLAVIAGTDLKTTLRSLRPRSDGGGEVETGTVLPLSRSRYQLVRNLTAVREDGHFAWVRRSDLAKQLGIGPTAVSNLIRALRKAFAAAGLNPNLLQSSRRGIWLAMQCTKDERL
jgi:hypothetical protein